MIHSERLIEPPETCLGCGGKLVELPPRKDRITSYKWYSCERCGDAYQTSERHDIRLKTLRSQLFQILGGSRCGMCAFPDARALQFDHIHGEGYAFRFGKDSLTRRKYAFYVEHPEIAKQELWVLCANCNWIKRVEQKECARRVKKKVRASKAVL